MLFNPIFERNVGFRWRSVATSSRMRYAEQLLADGIASVDVVRHLHVVARPQPAVGLAVKEDAARFGPVVGTGQMPDAPIKKYGRAGRDSDGDTSSYGLFSIGSGKVILEVAAGQHVEVAAALFSRVG